MRLKAMALPSEAPETTDFNSLPRDLGDSACIDMQSVSAPKPKRSLAKEPRNVGQRAIGFAKIDYSGINIKIILAPVNRRGRSSALLPDGTVLVVSSRQPFLDAARMLIAAGYDPDSWLEGWRPGATAFALRARLGIASGLTVDETRTVFAPWKPFSQSAVSSSICHSDDAATTIAPAPPALLLAPPEQQSKTAESELHAARPASSVADECTDHIPANFDNGSAAAPGACRPGEPNHPSTH
jgi:hypothetical protein